MLGRGTETPHAELADFFLSASWVGGLLVSPPPSPPPRGESARGSAAAAIFPPFRTHGAWGRSAAATRDWLEKGPILLLTSARFGRRLRRAPRLGLRHRPCARGPPPSPSPFVSFAPALPPRLALCRGRSARPQWAREKPRSARLRLRGGPLLLPACARARLLVARRRRLAGGRGGGSRVCRRGAPLRSFTPWKVDLERQAGRRRGSATRVQRRLRAAMWGAVPRWV